MAWWAQFFLYIHFFWVVLVIAPVPFIIVGGILRWPFIRNPWFRYIHVGMMTLVLALTVFRIECPLTTLENYFRTKAGEDTYQGTFIEAWVARLLYQDLSPTTFLFIYIGFFAVIVALLLIIPPRRGKKIRRD